MLPGCAAWLVAVKAGVAFTLALAGVCGPASLAIASPGGARATGTPAVVETHEGAVKGIAGKDVIKFLGIPYAEPPTGALRWMPPKDRTPWTGIRTATQFAPICALRTTLGAFAGPANDNEDCLYLNVFTPTARPAEKLPVIVFVHGGGNFTGDAASYDGSALASGGKVVVVTIQYRLNLLGFLAHPALDNEGHPFGNYGILDQQAALRWVLRNIDGFGGDSNNVTLAGQSAGALDTMVNLVSPLAAGLFHRAICQSACLATYEVASRETAEAIGAGFAAAAGCGSGMGPDVARCLRGLPASRIAELSGTAQAPSRFVVQTGIVDGTILPDQPLTLFKNGRFNRVPVMNGTTQDERNFTLAIMTYFTSAENALRTPPTKDHYLQHIGSTYVAPGFREGTAAGILELYPPAAFASPYMAWNRAASDYRACDVRTLVKILARQVPVYGYQFRDRTAPSYFPDMPGMHLGAYHTADLQYYFPGWHGGPTGMARPLNGKQRELSARLISAWAEFARTGNPNGSGSGPWPRYTEAADAPGWAIQDLSAWSAVTDDEYVRDHHCRFWDATVQND